MTSELLHFPVSPKELAHF